MILMQNFGCRVAAAALALAAVGLSVTPASAELRLSTPRPEVQRLLSVDEQAAGKSQAALVEAVEHFKANRAEDCQKSLREATRLTPSLPPAELMFARMFLRTGNDAEALRRLDRLAVDFPDQPEVFVSLGELALRQGRLTDAWLQLERSASLKPPATWDDARIRAFRNQLSQLQGEAAERREDWSAAERFYRYWSEHDPQSAAALLGLGRARLGQNVPDEAIKLFRRAREFDAKSPAAETLLALIYARRGAQEQAGEWFAKAVADSAVSPETRLEYARWLLDRERPEEARTELDSVANSKEADALKLFLRGVAARCLQDLDTAEAAFASLQQANPGDWAVANQLALVLIERPEELKRVRAAQLAEINLRQCPDRALALATAGWVQLRLGDLSNAERLLQQSLQAASPAPATQYYVSKLFAARGQTAEASRWLNEALESPLSWPERPAARVAVSDEER